MQGTSLNIAGDVLRKLKAIIPGAFTEDKLSVEQLKQLLGEVVHVDSERYQLSWAGKAAAYKLLQAPTTDTLAPDAAASVNWDAAVHVLIQGENLGVLKVLQKPYYEQVKLILIDPPYNTGSDSFIYPDKFSETREAYLKRLGDKDEAGFMVKEGLFRTNRKENGQFHSNWLSMMLPRLFLARNLLKEDGAILVHIDEHEQANLTLLLNEVFGEENLLGHIVWDKGNPKGDAGGVAYQHESILVYAKNKVTFLAGTNLARKKRNAERMLKKAAELFKKLGKEELPEELRKVHKAYGLPAEMLQKYKRKLTLEDINKQFSAWLKTQGVSGGELAYNKIDAAGNVYRLVSMAWPNKKKAPDDYFVPLVHPVTNKPCPVPQRGWRYPTATVRELLSRGDIIFGADERVQPQRKYLLQENMTENLPSILFYGGSDDDLLRKLELEFENPKPVEFTRSLVQAFTRPDSQDVVLDFFAGSGTTAHAVLEANRQDGGNRSFICVQLPEQLDAQSEMYKKGYRSIFDLTMARIKSVIEKANAEAGTGAEGSNGSTAGVRCFSLVPSNFKVWRSNLVRNKEELARQLSLFASLEKEAAAPETMLWELLLKSGLPLTERVRTVQTGTAETIYLAAANTIAFCLDSYSEAVQEEVLYLKPSMVVCLDSVFKNDDCHKTNSLLKLRENGIGFKTV